MSCDSMPLTFGCSIYKEEKTISAVRVDAMLGTVDAEIVIFFATSSINTVVLTVVQYY